MDLKKLSRIADSEDSEVYITAQEAVSKYSDEIDNAYDNGTVTFDMGEMMTAEEQGIFTDIIKEEAEASAADIGMRGSAQVEFNGKTVKIDIDDVMGGDDDELDETEDDDL